jgi:hypothetical protein
MSFFIYCRKTCPDTGKKHRKGYVEFKKDRLVRRSAWFQTHDYYKT